jgi:catechol 2,3-dioxygenase-like lactoylglutathione lyase family enzyme
MLGTSEIIAFVATTRVVQASAFYRDTLGLRLVADTPFAQVFDAHGTMLRLTPVQEWTPPPFTVLGWRVGDLRATARGLAAKGVAFQIFSGMGQDADGIWTTPDGSQVAWFRDPDGNTLSLTQFA